MFSLVFHENRVIILFFAKCMCSTLFNAWDTFTNSDTEDQHTSTPDALIQYKIHFMRQDAHTETDVDVLNELIKSGYKVCAVLRDPTERFVSFYINKWIILYKERFNYIFKDQFIENICFYDLVDELGRIKKTNGEMINIHCKPFSYDLIKIHKSENIKIFDMTNGISSFKLWLHEQNIPEMFIKSLDKTINKNPNNVWVNFAYSKKNKELPKEISYECLLTNEIIAKLKTIYKDDYQLLIA